jgi:thiamine-phosphate pyrophosphorylase
MNNKSGARCRLYLITPPNIILNNFRDKLASALDGGDVACVQLRLKNTSDDEILHAIEVLAPIAQERNVAFVINDNPELAAQTGCDGVHIGQKDIAFEQAREIVGSNAIVGVTCHDQRYLAIEAAEKGADYVAFGAFFPSKTKKTICQPELEILKIWNTMTTVPSVAIGGISHNNCSPLIRAGADFLAVISAIWNFDSGPAAAVKLFNQIIAENH